MPDWDELFARGERVARFPERPVHDFVTLIERAHVERPLRIWDLCCGAGRHTEAIAARGHIAFASDLSPNGVALTRERLTKRGLNADVIVADMTVCPWPDANFHGVLSWSALHHNRLSAIEMALESVLEHLVPGGWFLANLKSTRADSFGAGEEIEPGTFVQETGRESGVPHHYFDESGIRSLFGDWELMVLLERRCDYRKRCPDFLEINPFDYTAWEVLARRPESM
jgi:SAM-dependent methyltransferase